MTAVPISLKLLDRYDRPAPRYTSYPPIPFWHNDFGEQDGRAALAELAASDDPVTVYTHLPFCVARCYYCGCNATVTRNPAVQSAYVDRLARELDLVGTTLAGRRRATGIHWGGGTPNFLGATDIERLLDLLRDRFEWAVDAELSIEIDPRVASAEQLAHLRRLGFNRLSLGVQDFDADVQCAIGRVQSEALVRELRDAASGLGFRSVNFDLVYGLPRQTLTSFARTLELVIAQGPDRIACFAYAHVPWMRPNQKRILDSDLPTRGDRFQLFQLAVEMLTGAGYQWIGLDHFARPGDDLATAQAGGRLRRNFMGYVIDPAPHLLAFGASSISEVAGRFLQNDPKLGGYQRAIDAGTLPIVRGHVLTPEDRIRRAAIERLMCDLELPYSDLAPLAQESDPLTPFRQFVDEDFIRCEIDRLRVTDRGRFFLRNICTALDAYSARAPEVRFSRAV